MEVHLSVAIGSIILGFFSGYAVSVMIETINDKETGKVIDDTNNEIISLRKKNDSLKKWMDDTEDYIASLRRENRELKINNRKLSERLRKIKQSVNEDDKLKAPTSPLERQVAVNTDSDGSITIYSSSINSEDTE